MNYLYIQHLLVNNLGAISLPALQGGQAQGPHPSAPLPLVPTRGYISLLSRGFA